ncbi:reverse transcriptase domain-containing protein [Tanacetum coccineum]
MSTRSSARRLLSPIEDPERLLSRRNRSEPSLLFDLEEDDMAGQAPPQGAARTWLEKEPQNSITTWNGLVSKFVNRFFPPSKTTNLQNEITRFQQRFGETFAEASDRFKDLLNKCLHHVFSPLRQIDTFHNSLNQSEQDSLNSAAGGNFLTKNTQEALTIIKNKSKVQTSRNKPQASSASGSSTQDAHITSLTKQVEAILSLHRQVNSVQNGCETCGGPHAYYECQAAGGYTQEDVYATTCTYNQGGNSYQPQVLHERPQGALPSNTEPNPRDQVNSIMTRSGLATAEPFIPPLVPPTPRVEMEKEPETLMDEVHITSPTSTAHVPPPGVQPVSPPKPKEYPKPNPYQLKIPYSSRLNKTKLLDKNDVQISKFLKILNQLHFDISLMDALTQIPKFIKVLKDLLKDKEKLEELANTLINAECSAILLNKVPKKLKDPRKFLIHCILQNLEVCNSLADSGASINLMPLSIYEKLGIGPLKPTRMTLELANRSITFPMGIAEDVIVKVENFNFLADFVIIDFDADPRVPIILGRPFLRTAKALVDLYEEKLTLRVENKEVVLTPFETSDSFLEEFADELALLDPFPLGNEDDNFNPEADLREIKYLLNRDSSTVFSPTTDIIDPILERFTDEHALVYSSPPGDDDDALFDFKSDNDERKKLLYGDSYNDTHSENEKTKDSNIKSLIDELESSVLLPQLLDGDLTLHKELPEIDTLTLFPFENKDKVFNPSILVHGSTQIVTKVTPDKSLTLKESNVLSHSSDHSSDRDLLFFLESTMTETLLSFSSKNEDKVFNPRILILKGVHPLSSGILHQSFDAFKVLNVYLNSLESPMKIFPFFCFYYGGDVSSLNVLYLHLYPL